MVRCGLLSSRSKGEERRAVPLATPSPLMGEGRVGVTQRNARCGCPHVLGRRHAVGLICLGCKLPGVSCSLFVLKLT